MTDKLLSAFPGQIAELTLQASQGGRFEVSKDDQVLFSKAELERHADPEEIIVALRSGERVQE